MLSGLEAVETMLAAEDQGGEAAEEAEEEADHVLQDAGATQLEDAERGRPDAAARHDAAAAAASEQAAVQAQAPAIEAPCAQAAAEVEDDSKRRQSLGAESAVAGVEGGARADVPEKAANDIKRRRGRLHLRRCC